MQTITSQETVRAGQERDAAQPAIQSAITATRAILFEARTLLALSTSAMDWLDAHPRYQALSFSHAHETRLEPVASLAGPRSYSVYTGVLLVRPPARVQTPERPERLPKEEALLSGRSV